MSVNLPEQKKKEGMLDTLSTVTSIAANAYNIKEKMGEGDKKPETDSTAHARRIKKLTDTAMV